MESRSVALMLCVIGLSILGGGNASSSPQWRKHSRRVDAKANLAQHPISRRKANYPTADDAAAPQAVDLHNKEFCVDVSTYQPVVWVESESEECSTVFVKKCEDKSENVCTEVTETKCEVIPHIKMLPECRNVTKQNCVTLWETDPNGKQVWAGNEACEPVTWQECKLVPKNVKFIVPEINCTDGNEVWYHEPEVSTEVRMTNTFTCEVKSSSNCKTQTRPDCKSITYQECKEIPVTNCNPKTVHKPTQERLHRKKCLLPDEEPAPADPIPQSAPDSYGQPIAAPVTSLPSYGGSK